MCASRLDVDGHMVMCSSISRINGYNIAKVVFCSLALHMHILSTVVKINVVGKITRNKAY